MMRRTPIKLVLSATVLATLGVAADFATAQVKHPVTHEALWLAPDSERVTGVLSTFRYATSSVQSGW